MKRVFEHERLHVPYNRPFGDVKLLGQVAASVVPPLAQFFQYLPLAFIPAHALTPFPD